MAEMAKPWKHPQTGVYYLRRQIPAAIREAFDHRSLHKASLGTKDLRQATVLFLQANADLRTSLKRHGTVFVERGAQVAPRAIARTKWSAAIFYGRLSQKAVWPDRRGCCWLEPRLTEVCGIKPSMAAQPPSISRLSTVPLESALEAPAPPRPLLVVKGYSIPPPWLPQP